MTSRLRRAVSLVYDVVPHAAEGRFRPAGARRGA